MDPSLLTILDNSLDPNSPYFVEAQQRLQAAKENNLAEFMMALSEVVINPKVNLPSRHLAGILLKNCFEFKTEQDKMTFFRKMNTQTLMYLKNRMLIVMKTTNEPQAILSACTVISRIAQMELTTRTWPEFFDVMFAMINSNHFVQTRSAFVCLNQLIEDLGNLYDTQGVNLLSVRDTNRLLTSVIKGIYSHDPNTCRIALRCLHNLLYFVETNMDIDGERDVIVEAVCRRCASNNDLDIRTASFDCLVQLVTEYYSQIVPRLPIIVPFLWEAIDSEIEQIAIPALEFWNSICEIEMERSTLPVREPPTINGIHDHSILNEGIIRQVIPYLVPKILYTMTLHRFEDMDVDTWTLPMAAGVCLSLCTQTVRNDIVGLVLPFIRDNFTSAEWNRREAAVLAYGYIMEGPDTDTLKILVDESFDTLCDVLMDPSIAVRDTSAWTIARVASFQCSVVVNHLGSPDVPTSNFSKIARAMFDVPRVAVNICYFFHELCENINESYYGTSNLLDCMFTGLCEMLINRSLMEDSMERNLYSSIYSTLCALIAGVSNNCMGEMMALHEHFLGQVTSMISKDCYNLGPRLRIQSILGVVQILIARVGYVNDVNVLLKALFDFLSVEIDEDALLVLGAVINVTEPNLLFPYMPKIIDSTITGLRSDNIGLCKIAVELTSDVSRVLESGFIPYVEQFMIILVKILQDGNGDKSLKPPIITAMGDIAMAVGGRFAQYVPIVMNLLVQASSMSYNLGGDTDEWIHFLNLLQDSTLQAFTGIVYGLKEGNCLYLLRPYVTPMLEFTQKVVNMPSPYFDTNLYKLAVGLIGDLTSSFGRDLTSHLVNSPLIRGISAKLGDLEATNDPSLDECRQRVVWLHSTLEPV